MAAQVNGYWNLNNHLYDTYDHWREYCLSHGINVDFSYGNQCWDVCAMLWHQYNLRLETGNGYAYGCWVYKRDVNARFPFTKIETRTGIKRGDCVVFAPSGLNYTGHIAFADEDYNGSDYMNFLGQNQGQGISSGTPSNIVRLNIRPFLGAFRNSKWQSVAPIPPIKTKPVEKRFPWVIYERKFRNNHR